MILRNKSANYNGMNLKISNMEININLVEVATKLAHNRLLEQLNLTEEESISQIYEEDEDSDSLTYREGVQELFDEFYDEYYNEILMLKKDE